jgi:hypothetical protein
MSLCSSTIHGRVRRCQSDCRPSLGKTPSHSSLRCRNGESIESASKTARRDRQDRADGKGGWPEVAPVEGDYRRARASTAGGTEAGAIGLGGVAAVARARDRHGLSVRCARGRRPLPVARVEAPTATRCRQARHVDPRQPLFAGHRQVEEGRAPPFLVHLDQLAPAPLRTSDSETVINLIGNTTNRGGLVVRARLDHRRYPTGMKISKTELRELRIERDDCHGDWNYVISSREWRP